MKAPRAAILVVEDDPAIREGLLDVLVFNGFSAEGVEDGGDGLERALSGRFDLILLDVMLPTLDGFTICRRVRRKRPGQGIILLTAKGAEDDIVTGFKSGADDYVSKPFSLRELMVRVEAVLRRSGKQMGEERLIFRGITIDGATLTATAGETTVDLTRREMDLLVYLHSRPDRIVSKRELLTEVWHYADPDVETRTVDIHIHKLRAKIAELIGEVPVIITVRGEGYRLETGE